MGDATAEEIANAEHFLDQVDSVLLNGAKLILNKVYDAIGLDRIPDSILRQLVVARLCQPMSKMAIVYYLKSHFEEDVDLSKIYRLDKLYNTQREDVQRISVEHTFNVLVGRVEMLFYDVTSLYFESFREDVLRSPGFSKDCKTAETQIILRLLVCENGYHLAYSIFNGDRLVVTYSSKRASKDEFNRNKGVERLKKYFASGKVTKDKINKRGYNKFLKIENDVAVSIDEGKIAEDAKWDGLKGYVTNTALKPEEVVPQYSCLWVVVCVSWPTKCTRSLNIF